MVQTFATSNIIDEKYFKMGMTTDERGWKNPINLRDWEDPYDEDDEEEEGK